MFFSEKIYVTKHDSLKKTRFPIFAMFSPKLENLGRTTGWNGILLMRNFELIETVPTTKRTQKGFRSV